MIFSEHECIFFHISKTAGTSIEHWLNHAGRDLSLENVKRPQYDSLFGYCPQRRFYLQHSTAETVKSFVSEIRFWGYYKFAIVRNPFTRIYSEYNFNPDRQQTFEQYVLSLPERLKSQRVSMGAHSTPQHKYVFIDGVSICDDVFRFENLGLAETALQKELCLSKPMPMNNRSKPKEPMRFTSEMADIVARAYRLDFTLFGYSTDPPTISPVSETVEKKTCPGGLRIRALESSHAL